ncbi:uncharacterized protein [Oryza sativa Japonica Group]|uniref:uncharacterized protein n=1 Tax=Oryza sativa subsp. japonica TaxID=39947 RepID=UPI00339C8DD8
MVLLGVADTEQTEPQEEFDRVSNLETAYEIWNKLAEIHEGTSEYKDAKLHFLKIQYETFSMLPHESVEDMYGRLNATVNDLKGLGANYTDVEVAQKMVRALPEKYETLVTMLINSDMPRMTPASLLGKINTNDMYKLKKKEMEEASPSKKCMALQAEVENMGKGEVNEVNEDLEEEIALLARRFNDLLGRRKERGRGYNSNRRRNRRPNKTLSNLRVFECGEKGHFASKCPSKDDDGDKSSKKKSGGYKLMKKLKQEGKKIEAFIGEWDSNEESSASSSATCHIAHIASSSISTSCDDLVDMPSSSSSSRISICNASLVVENNELKEQVAKLNKSLERCFKGKNTLDKILSEQREFEMSMIGESSFFLGLQIKQLKDGTFVSQTKYIKDLLKRFGLEDAKPIKTPMATNRHLDLDEGVMPPRTRHGRRAPTPDPVSEPEESCGNEYAQSDEEVEVNVEGASEEASGDDDSGSGEDEDEGSDDMHIDPSIAIYHLEAP